MERYDEKDGVWRTINGQHIFIKDGEDISTAMARHNMSRGMKEKGREGMAREIDKQNEEEKQPSNMRVWDHNGRKVRIYDHRGIDQDAPVDGKIASWAKQKSTDDKDYEFWDEQENYYKKYHNVR